MVKIEVLYNEYMNLYGDTGNIKYLEKCIDKVKIIYTGLNDKPKFLTQKIDMLYLGPCTENHQEEIISFFFLIKTNKKLIDDNVVILVDR